MKPKSLKAQIAVENIILYSVVLVVIIVSLIVLWKSGVLVPAFGKRGYVGFSQIVPTDWTIGSDKAYINFKNIGNLPLVIEQNAINVSFDWGTLVCKIVPDYRITIDPEESKIIEVPCPGLSNKYDIGEYYEADVSITYKNLPKYQQHMSVGKLYGRIEAIPKDWAPLSTTSTSLPLGPPQCFNHECSKVGEMDNENCGDIIWREECKYCPLNPDPVDGKRKCHYNGACGSTCTSNNDCDILDPFLDDLNLCTWCNTASGKCEENPAQPSPVTCDITANITVTNNTIGKVVRIDEDIYQNVTGKSCYGVEKLIISNSIRKPPEYSCKEIAYDRNMLLGEITNPYGGEDGDTAKWLSYWGITWREEYTGCGGTNICNHIWTTRESEFGKYCYFAIAQEYSPTGNGRWSYIAADEIQVGKIQVNLYSPENQGK